MKKTEIPIKNIDDYLAQLPENQRIMLEELRQTIREAAPQAEEVISYQMPAFKYNGMLVYFAAFKNHCSLFGGNASVIKEMAAELKDYKTSTGTIQFTDDKPLPAALVRKIVLARVKENEAKVKTKKSTLKNKDADRVEEYMAQLEHPLKAEIEALRAIIQGANSKIMERIKWNAPSYYAKEDMVTFHLRSMKKVDLVFHHAAIVKIKSDLLKGEYKDRRLMHFENMEEVKQHQTELERILNEYVELIEKFS